MSAPEGRTVLITGATSGLGRSLATRLGTSGHHVIICGRSAERARQVKDGIITTTGRADVDVVLADFADLDMVDRMADYILNRYSRLDVLVNNAAVGGGMPGDDRELSKDGIELRFAVNYLAGYHLTRRLVPLLVSSAPSRVVNISSVGQQAVDFDDPMFDFGYTGMRAYSQSKLAQIMFTFDLADELRDRGVMVNAIHPATFMDTGMVRETGQVPFSGVEEGVKAVWPLIVGREGVTGRYYHRESESQAEPQAYDLAARARLRELSDELITRALPRRPPPVRHEGPEPPQPEPASAESVPEAPDLDEFRPIPDKFRDFLND